MPLYEYKCDQCQEVFEVMQKFSDAPLETHEGCGGRVKRLISAPALQFKGSGWYITDYARSGGNGGRGSNGKSSGSDNRKESGAKAPASSSDTPAKS